MKLAQVNLKEFEARTIKIPRINRKSDEYPLSAGITIEHNGAPGTVIAQAWATNAARGFSTGFSFTSTNCDCEPGEKRHLYGTGVPIGVSPMMQGATFNPLLILRNTSHSPIKVAPTFNFMLGDIPKKIRLPNVTLAKQETRVTNLRQYQQIGLIPDVINTGSIELEFESESGGLIAELASVSSTGFYTSQVPLVCSGKNALHMSYWRTDGDWDSVLQIENISTESTRAEITISYPGGLYIFEKPLKAGESAMISIKELQQTQLPDNNGKVLPLSAIMGGANIWSEDANQALVINGMIINAVTGTCGFCGGFGAVQAYGLTDMPQNCFGTAFQDYEVGETVPLYMAMYFDTAQCGSDSVQNLQVSTPSVFEVADSTTLLVVGIGSGQFSAETQNTWSGPDDPNCQSPSHLGASDGFEVRPAVSSLGVSMPSTKNPVTNKAPAAGSVTITNTSTAFATESSSDLVTIFQSSTVQMTVSASGVNPESAASQLRWKIDRDPSDTVTTGLPGLSATTGAEVSVTPSTAGNFRLIVFVDSNANNAYNAGEEIRVLRFAVVRVASLEDCTIDRIDPMFTSVASGGTQIGVETDGIMAISCTVTLEGGGANRLIGVNKVTIGDVGNLTSENFQINFPIPTPTPAAPGNVAGTESENPGGSLPMVDTGNVSLNQEPSGGNTAFRSSNNNPGTGAERTITAEDNPGFGPWHNLHPVTNNPWATTQGGYNFREYIAAYTSSFPRYYVVLARADWTITCIGSKSGTAWTNTSSAVTVGTGGGGSAAMTSTVTSGSPQSADSAGVQVLGLSYVNQRSIVNP